MDQKSFYNGLINGKKDMIQEIIDVMFRYNIEYCVIGGLAVNAYVEPVVSLDLDIVVVAGSISKLLEMTKDKYHIKEFPHSINLGSNESDIRIQLQTDTRYQEFIHNSQEKEVMGYTMQVASLKDVLKGKTWAYLDTQRRGSKRQKDLADIMRIIESFPGLKSELSKSILKKIR